MHVHETGQHEWVNLGSVRPHFEYQPNSRRDPPKETVRLGCACGQRAFRYVGSAVVYTWGEFDPTC